MTQVTFTMPMKRLSMLFRYEPEFSALKRAQGNTPVISASYTF